MKSFLAGDFYLSLLIGLGKLSSTFDEVGGARRDDRLMLSIDKVLRRVIFNPFGPSIAFAF